MSRSGLAVRRYDAGRLQKDLSVFESGRFGSPFSSKVVVYGHCLVTLSLTINETLKWFSSVTAHLNAGVILVVTLCSDRYLISLFPYLHTPFPNKPSVSVDVKHHVYFTYLSTLKLRSCVKIEVAVLGSPSLISLVVSVDVKQHWSKLGHFSLPVSGTGLPLTVSTTSLWMFFFILGSYYLSTKQSGDHYAALMLAGGSLGMGAVLHYYQWA